PRVAGPAQKRMAHRRRASPPLLHAQPRRGSALPEPQHELVGARHNDEPPDRPQKVGHQAMHASEVIETYIDDTARLLPRRQRDDVATELRSLLNEGLHARAQESGRPPDESLALSLVRDYGHPSEVAARYQPPWAIIDPADSTNFLRAALIGAGVLLLLGTFTTGIWAWLGVLVVGFAA